MGPLLVVSFGYLHLAPGEVVEAERVVDVRGRLDDPAAYRAVLALLAAGPVDGRDERVRAVVVGQAATGPLVDELAELAEGVAVLAIGCGQGHDRSVVLAELVAERARAGGRAVVVEHRHVDRPRVR